MKKIQFFACACALAMASTVGFTSCQSNDPQQRVPQITTDIALSLPTQVGNGIRRMPSATVQNGGATDFATNGMKGITLVPFAPSAVVTTSSTRLGDNIVLGEIGTTQSLSQSADGRAKVFTGKQVPTGTSAFLFYGESGKTGTSFQTGVLTGSLAGEPSAITFTLSSIVTNASTVESDAAYEGLIAYLNAVANAEIVITADPLVTKKWKEYTALDNEGLYDMFQTYKTAKSLSSFGIRRMMTDLYQSLMSSSDPMATAIKTAIADATYATVDGSGDVTLVSGLQGFPESFNLPQGAVAVAYNAESQTFGGNAAHAFGGLEPAQVDRYVYPASLWYFANSKIHTSTTTKEANYTGATSWNAILNSYEKKNSSVNTSTRSIAIVDTIQYAVARLDVRIKTKENAYLEDNDPVTTNNHVDNPALGWQMTGVLIGGQKHVGFDFTPATYGGGVGTEFTIYDKEMTSTIYAVTADYSAANSTLVLETAANADEYVAVELVNSSAKDFYGADGIVPVGAKFYLVGKLTASAATETGNQVFKQDYTTTARFAIKDLKSAYVNIPDLKSPQLEIGMSVDLSWKSGHTYDVEL